MVQPMRKPPVYSYKNHTLKGRVTEEKEEAVTSKGRICVKGKKDGIGKRWYVVKKRRSQVEIIVG